MQYSTRECSLQKVAHSLVLRLVLAALATVAFASTSPVATDPAPPRTHGQWNQLGRSGVPAMHVALMPNGKVVFLDKAEPWTYAVLPNGNYTFSTEFDPKTGVAVPLTVTTNTFCSAGGHLPDGTLVNLGGAQQFRGTSEGFNVIRSLKPCQPTLETRPQLHSRSAASTIWSPLQAAECDWQVEGATLADHRWYPSAASLEDGRLIVVGGSNTSVGINADITNVPTYEFYPREQGSASIYMPFLVDTMPFNLYPGLHLLPNGNLFIWASTRAMEFDHKNNQVVRVYPDIPGPPRSYPLTGSSVLLPLDPDNNYKAEIIVFGGSRNWLPSKWTESPGLRSLQRIDLSQDAPQWEREMMPLGRVMPDGVILADGTIFISNGAEQGAAGYNVSQRLKATNPASTPVIYHPDHPRGRRFRTMARSRVPRLYHSVSLLLPDGRVLVAGSNPIDKPTETPPQELRWGTEFRVEAFSPPYLFVSGRARLEVVAAPDRLAYGTAFSVTVRRRGSHERRPVAAALVHTGFVTHSVHMSQRYIRLGRAPALPGPSSDTLRFFAPPNGAIAPPGPYMLFLLEDQVPCSRAPFVLVGP